MLNKNRTPLYCISTTLVVLTVSYHCTPSINTQLLIAGHCLLLIIIDPEARLNRFLTIYISIPKKTLNSCCRQYINVIFEQRLVVGVSCESLLNFN